jgi:two-component system, chemotaxis family, CheB/CheR fusion protein
VSALENANPWLAADLRDAANQQHVVAELLRKLDAADVANVAKSRFLAIASHDLSEPLQSLFSLNCALRTMVSEPEAASALRQKEKTILAMSRLLGALLDVSGRESATAPQSSGGDAEPERP